MEFSPVFIFVEAFIVEDRRRKVSTDLPQLDWQDWMHRYDQQQSTYLPDREKRFTVMLDVLETLLPEHFVALDLACGPGSMSQRLLSRFPQARSVAVDIDPILLLLGQQVLGDMQGRLRWVEADISEPSWHSRLGEEQVDAVVSTTALHWLPAGSLVDLYRQLGDLVRPGGVFLNGDFFGFAPHLPSFNAVCESGHARTTMVNARVPSSFLRPFRPDHPVKRQRAANAVWPPRQLHSVPLYQLCQA